MAAFRAGEASWLMMCWATTEATPELELSFSWKDTVLGAPMVGWPCYGKSPFLMGKSTISMVIYGAKMISCSKLPFPWRIHGAGMVTWIPSIYPSHVSIYIPAPWISHGLWEKPVKSHDFQIGFYFSRCFGLAKKGGTWHGSSCFVW